MSAPPVVPFVITDHAKGVMARRGITFDVVAAVLTAPAQRYTVRPGRDVVQALIEAGNPAVRYVVRIFVDVDRSPAEVVTVYRSSKITKYWRGPT